MSTTAETPMRANVSFRLSMQSASTQRTFAPRLGTFEVHRTSPSSSPHKVLSIDTPGLITSTSRGVIPHLSRDHVSQTHAIQWVNVPYETYLERMPPIPPTWGGPHPLHGFLGFPPDRHVLSMSLRDPFDVREMPPNGNKFVNAYCIRGVRQVTPSSWREYVLACNPDIVIALSDIPFTRPPFSQKRISKSIERSLSWLATLLHREARSSHLENDLTESADHPLNVLVQMMGDTVPAARQAFSFSLTETLHGKEAEQIAPLKCLDDGITGYTFDLSPLRNSVLVNHKKEITEVTAEGGPAATPSMEADVKKLQVIDEASTNPLTKPHPSLLIDEFTSLMRSSLSSLPVTKLRLVNSAGAPHEILRLIQCVGIDLFDAHWAQKAADWGVALDFIFPAPRRDKNDKTKGTVVRPDGKRDLGHNLYNTRYASDFGRFSACFGDGFSTLASSSSDSNDDKRDICPCLACSPTSPYIQLKHSSIDEHVPEPGTLPAFDPPFSRAYVHHLLHTHEMSAHALLAMHNISVLGALFQSIRRMISSSQNTQSDQGSNSFDVEVERFCEFYDDELRVFEEAKKDWINVDYARGKGRLAREKQRQAEESLDTKIEVKESLDEGEA